MKLLVVARFREDTAWTEQTDWQVQIVQKHVDLPNRGREPSSFLWAMDRLYDSPPDVTAFVQGNPFDHCPDLLDRLARPVDWYSSLGNWHPTSDGNGGPHHTGLSVAACHEAWMGVPFSGAVTFTAGGQFAITANALLSRPRAFYRRMYDDLMADETKAWVAERLWPLVFA